jgi:hypothetical protein
VHSKKTGRPEAIRAQRSPRDFCGIWKSTLVRIGGVTGPVFLHIRTLL